MSLAFAHPRLKDLAIGEPEWFRAQLRVIQEKPLVKRCYDLWYARLLADLESVPAANGRPAAIELGSGAGYVKTLRPDIITSDVVCGVADVVLDGRRLPF